MFVLSVEINDSMKEVASIGRLLWRSLSWDFLLFAPPMREVVSSVVFKEGKNLWVSTTPTKSGG